MKLNNQEQQEAMRSILQKIITNTYNNILLELRFLDVALSNLQPKADPNVKYFDTDGKHLYYNEKEVIRVFKISPQKLARDMVHTLLHCILLHLFYTKTKIPLWELSCDIAVEQVIVSMNLQNFTLPTDLEKKQKLEYFIENIKPFTPQNILKFLQEENYSKNEIMKLEKLFQVDEHEFWEQFHQNQQDENEENKDNDSNLTSMQLRRISWDQLMKLWQKTGTIVLINMQSFSKKQGDKAGFLMQELENLNHESYDYKKFLKRFAQRKEITKINDDEFDYIFYTYGLNMDKERRMPLIEPLEYKDSYVIRDFVIAIDTSGSTSGETVQMFLQKTYNILKSTETFTKKMNIYIIQCDAEIQEVKQITSFEDLENYIKIMKIKGLGGTDFRPVFKHVNTMVKNREFTKLKGLIYFTDGYGTFPSVKTTYDTAFIFIDKNDFKDVTVPPWAMKVLLSEDNIKEM